MLAAVAVNKGGSGCTSSSPCAAGGGDCDSDSDCDAGLECFQRDGGEEVPGVASMAGMPSGYDFCYDPSSPAGPYLTPSAPSHPATSTLSAPSYAATSPCTICLTGCEQHTGITGPEYPGLKLPDGQLTRGSACECHSFHARCLHTQRCQPDLEVCTKTVLLTATRPRATIQGLLSRSCPDCV